MVQLKLLTITLLPGEETYVMPFCRGLALLVPLDSTGCDSGSSPVSAGGHWEGGIRT